MRAFIFMLFLLANSMARAQIPRPDTAAVKPLVEVWRKCAMDKAGAFVRSGESAETIAKVALYECRDDRANVLGALMTAYGTATTATHGVERLEADMRDFLISLVVQAKSK